MTDLLSLSSSGRPPVLSSGIRQARARKYKFLLMIMNRAQRFIVLCFEIATAEGKKSSLVVKGFPQDGQSPKISDLNEFLFFFFIVDIPTDSPEVVVNASTRDWGLDIFW